MQRRIGTFVFALALLFGLGAIHPAGTAFAHDEEAATPLLGNLGDHHREITTGSEEAQAYFDQGLVLAYGFNHELAVQSFQEAARHDPACAMCYWGIAWALGPNINLPMDPALNPAAWEALQQAQALADDASPVEQAMIEALAARYSADAPENRAELDLAFAEAMGEVAAQYPDDADVLAISAEAMMDLMPWNFWTAEGEPTEYTARILATLEEALAINPDHPAANHYYIHATEASQDPGRALESARRLETLVPGAGHLVHMPAHTYWRTGRYADAVRVNVHAAHSDETAAAGMPDPGTYNFYSVAYYPHNIHFESVAAGMMGDSATAIDAARRLVEVIPEQAYLDLPFFEDFRPMPYQALVRFGRWQEMVDEPAPGEELPFATALWHYARGVALANLGRIDEAEDELAALEAAKSNEAFEGLVMASFASAEQNLDMATGILSAAIAGAKGDRAEAIAQLEAAIAIQDSLPYIEPPAWYFPIRQLLGPELLANGQAEAAEAVYRKDLEQYPANGWSLFGLAQALEAQGKTGEAETVRGEFEAAWSGSDVVLAASACPCEMAAGRPAADAGEEIDEAALVEELLALEENAGGHHHSDDSAKTHARGEAEAIVIGKDAVLLVYPLTLTGEAGSSQEYISSLWVKRDGRWQQVFMQSTPIATD
jgi:tetratricopeptide (TPR) repeat protein